MFCCYIGLPNSNYFACDSGGEVLWWTRLSVCLSVCLCVRQRPHARSLPNFSVCCLWPWLGSPPAGWRNPKGKGQFWGFSSPLTMHCNTFAAKGIIQYRPGRGWRECTSRTKCNLRLPCCKIVIKTIMAYQLQNTLFKQKFPYLNKLHR